MLSGGGGAPLIAPSALKAKAFATEKQQRLQAPGPLRFYCCRQLDLSFTACTLHKFIYMHVYIV